MAVICERMTEAHDLFSFLEHEWTSVLERWEKEYQPHASRK